MAWQKKFKEIKMFKRFGIGVLVAVTLLLGVAGTALAQEPAPPVDGACPYGGTCGGYGMGGYGYQGTMHDTLAQALGMTSEDLYAAMAEGWSVAELAEAQGVELADLAAALMAPQVERLEQAVEAGYMSQKLADWMIEFMTARMTLNFANFGMGYGMGYGGGCGMQGGMSGGGHRGGMMGGGHHGGMWGGNSNAPRTPFWQSQPES
jgi:hypothetical protein